MNTTTCAYCKRPCISYCPYCKTPCCHTYGVWNDNCGGKHESECKAAREARLGVSPS